MAFAEDVTQFFDSVAGFAETVRVDGIDVDAIVNLPSKDSDQVEDVEPSIVLAAADAVGIAQGDPVLLRGTNYTVTNIDPDETELILTLYLEEV